MKSQCQGTLIVLSQDDCYSVSCNVCGFGTTAPGPLPEFWLDHLLQEGYIHQLRREPVNVEILTRFFQRERYRVPSEIAGDVLERYEVFIKENSDAISS